MAKSPTKQVLNQQIHAGRRQKLRARFVTDGLDTFNECEVLEFALGFCIPRQDTNPAAHSLINRFGDLRGVVEAAPADLANAYGIGENAAVFLNFLKQFTTYLAKQEIKKHKIDTPKQAEEYLKPLMKTYAVEQFVVVCLDYAGNVRNINAITNNELDSVHVSMRELIGIVTTTGAAKVLVAHNHLNEDPLPSVADMNFTRRLVATFDTLDINFLDHLIFAGEKVYSFVTAGLMDAFKKEHKRRLID